MKGLSRRKLLAGSALGSFAMLAPSFLSAQSNLLTTRLTANIHLISGAGSNVVVAVGDNSAVVVDGGLQEFSTTLLQEIDRLSQGKPVSVLFNTNWRPEHSGLNYELGQTGTAIIAHENTRLWQNNDFYVDWEERQYHPMPVSAQANQTFYKSGSLSHEGETVEYGLISQFHTDGDIYIYFKESNVLIVSDMMKVSAYPLIDYVTGGSIAGAQNSTTGLLEIADDETLIVPANGGAQRRAALEVQQQMLDHAYEKVAEAYRTGRSLDQFMAAAPMADYDEIYGDSALFAQLLYRGTWYHVPGRAIRGII